MSVRGRLVSAVLSGAVITSPLTASAQYVRVSVTSSGAQANGPSSAPSLSADGRFVAFASEASNLVAGDTNGVSDIFLHDRDLDTDGIFDEPGAVATTHVSLGPGGVQADGASTAPVIFPDGVRVAFLSRAGNLVPHVPQGVQQVYLADRLTGAIELVSQSTGGLAADLDCDAIAVDGGVVGGTIAFRSSARTLAPGNPGAGGAVYTRRLVPRATLRVSPALFPDPAGRQPAVSPPAMSHGLGVVGFAVITPGARREGQVFVSDHDGNTTRPVGSGVGIRFAGRAGAAILAEWASDTQVATAQWLGVPFAFHREAGPIVERFVLAVSVLGRYAAFAGSASTTVRDFLTGFDASLPIGGAAIAFALDDTTIALETTAVAPFVNDTNGVSDIVVVDLMRAFDGDGDGMDDRWERLFGLDPTSAAGDNGATGDPDGDGLTNAQEYATSREGSHGWVGMTHPRALVRRYFAEGADNAFFHTRLALVNPDDTQTASVLVRYRRSDTDIAVGQPVFLPPRSRRTVSLASVQLNGLGEFAVEIESDREIVADRRMTWDGTGYGAHLESARVTPAATWYIAEGSTAGGFALFYLLYNPQPVAVTATIRYLRPSGAPIERNYEIQPRRRVTVMVKAVDPALAASDVSAAITATAPIVAERAMYADRAGQPFALGHVASGVTGPATRWFLAEGATGTFFDLYVLVANPSDIDADVTCRFLKPDGTTVLRALSIPAGARRTIFVDALPGLEATAVSTEVTSTNGVPIVVERSMYWPDSFYAYREGHSSTGSTATARRWALAEGENGGPADAHTYVLIANLAAVAGEARVTVLPEGGPPQTRSVPLPAGSRVTIRAGGGVDGAFGVLVESLGSAPVPIVVEGSIYWSSEGRFWSAGGNLLASPLP